MTHLLRECNTRIQRVVFAACCLLMTVAHAGEMRDVALITSLQGTATLATSAGHQPLQAFMQLRQGDLLSLGKGARLQIVYFESGRQEIWQGAGGRIEILASAGKAFALPDPEVKILNGVVAKQIGRTPAMDSQGRVAAVRLRAIATPEAVSKLENTYRQMRMEAVRGDLNPELFLLSGLYEMRLLDRVEQTLTELQRGRQGDPEVGLVVSLYQKAIRNARESRAQ